MIIFVSESYAIFELILDIETVFSRVLMLTVEEFVLVGRPYVLIDESVWFKFWYKMIMLEAKISWIRHLLFIKSYTQISFNHTVPQKTMLLRQWIQLLIPENLMPYEMLEMF